MPRLSQRVLLGAHNRAFPKTVHQDSEAMAMAKLPEALGQDTGYSLVLRDKGV